MKLGGGQGKWKVQGELAISHPDAGDDDAVWAVRGLQVFVKPNLLSDVVEEDHTSAHGAVAVADHDDRGGAAVVEIAV